MTQTTSPTVAREATQTSTGLGTFGSSTDLQALLRLSGGQTKTVSRGDRVNGQTVVAIEAGRIALSRNGTAEWLDMPTPSS